jgi:hypothetical protein
LVDEVVLADDGRRLAQVGGVSSPALDLESPLVVGVEEDRKVQCQESDGHHDAAANAGVGEAMMPLMQGVPPFMSYHVGDEQHLP